MDCDIFMWFYGGGIGHSISWEWDSFLQSDGHIADDLEGNLGVGEEKEGKGERERNEGAGDENKNKNKDQVLANDGDKLDNNLYAQEGYGTL